MSRPQKKRTNKFVLTPVKRSHLVSNSGVGSLVRLRNGATGLVAGLKSWEDTIPVAGSDLVQLMNNRRDYLRPYLIRDPELEAACGVTRFYQPPRAAEEDSMVPDWEIPVVVFPRSAICENFRCGSVTLDIPDTGLQPECNVCDPVATGRRKFRYRKKQAPIFLVCPLGHIDEVDWDSCVAHTEACTHSDIRIINSSSIRSPKIKCDTCNRVGKIPETLFCTGTSPWILGRPADTCGEKMRVVDRTSVQTYFNQSKSSIHVPAKSGLDPAILDWLLLNEDLRLIAPDKDDHVSVILADLLAAGFKIDATTTKTHLQHLKKTSEAVESGLEWDQLAARSHELDVFTGSVQNFVAISGRFLEFHNSDTTALDSDLFGSKGLFSKVVSLTRLTETRVQDGFSRWEPLPIATRAGYELMWGHQRPSDGWLPAYRAYGEGILFVLNPSVIAQWVSNSGFPSPTSGMEDPYTLSYVGTLAHSLAHLIMVRLSHECGYSLPSIQDRIYDLPDGRVAFLVYTAESDIMGTMGGLVEFGEGKKLESIVSHALQDGQWCSQDPVCASRIINSSLKQAACCHQCLFLPETSCERLNGFLDRSTIIGSAERGTTGVTKIIGR